MSTLIRARSERYKRSEEKVSKVIQFLKQEVYSDFQTLLALLNYKHRQPLYLLLSKMVSLGYLTKHEFKFPTGKMSLWGITQLGLSQEIGDIEGDLQAFEPHKVKFVTLNHRLMNQRARIYLERQGWTHWHNGDRFSFRKKYPLEHRPDAVMVTPKGHTIALETERTIKPVARYRSILKSHITAKQKKFWSAVFYIVPDEKVRELLSIQFDKIEYIAFDEAKYDFAPYREKLVRIFTLDELPYLTV